jgi:hypothetical protein
MILSLGFKPIPSKKNTLSLSTQVTTTFISYGVEGLPKQNL